MKHLVHRTLYSITLAALLSIQAIISINVSTSVSVGEVLDKITILQIKKERIKNLSKQANITSELDVLQRAFTENITTQKELEQRIDELRTINETLWTLEDTVRLKESQHCYDEEFKQLAAYIINRNDARARTKAIINRLTKSAIVEEKSYQEMTSTLIDSNAQSTLIAIEIPFAELIDKITILEVKLENITDKQKRSNIETELLLLCQTRDNACPITQELTDHINALRNANRTMFHIQDGIREKIKTQSLDNDFIELARSVYFTNDERCRIKRLINDLVGSHLVEEKEYTIYSATDGATA